LIKLQKLFLVLVDCIPELVLLCTKTFLQINVALVILLDRVHSIFKLPVRCDFDLATEEDEHAIFYNGDFLAVVNVDESHFVGELLNLLRLV